MRFGRAWIAIIAGLAIGGACAAATLLPVFDALEREFGLRWLFQLRGPVPAPSNILLVEMSADAASRIQLAASPTEYQRCVGLHVGQPSATHASLPALPARWPRCVHPHMIEALKRAGAKLIVFDVVFRPRPPAADIKGDVNAEQDNILAAALAAAGTVIVATKLEEVPGQGGRLDSSPLSDPIARAALGHAPFPLHRSPAQRIDRIQPFDESGSVIPTLPLLVLQAAHLQSYPGLRQMIADVDLKKSEFLPATVDDVRRQGQLQALTLHLGEIFRNEPRLRSSARASPSASDTGNSERNGLTALIDAYSDNSPRYLNFFGSSGSLPMLSYDAALALLGPSPPADLENMVRGKVVFVGFAERDRLEQMEHFATPVSRGDRPDLSGLELLATAYSNLESGTSIRRAPVALEAGLVFVIGFAITAAAIGFGVVTALAATVFVAAMYVAVALFLFSTYEFWIPLVASIGFAAPVGAAYGTAHRYVMLRRQRKQIRHAFEAFVPREIVDAFERNAGDVTSARATLDCVCVATDAAQFTTLAEQMESEQLADLLDHYYESLFKPVAGHGGFVSDVVGDAMLALWPVRSADTRRHACLACLEMVAANVRFSSESADGEFVTRFGVDDGEVALGTVGALGHYEYRAVGDAVNTSNRLQELNKLLGTRLLVSERTIEGLDGFLLRDMGWFVLRGKRQPVHVFELAGLASEAEPELLSFCKRFSAAMQLLRDGHVDAGLALLREITVRRPADVAARFYVDVLNGALPFRDGSVVLS